MTVHRVSVVTKVKRIQKSLTLQVRLGSKRTQVDRVKDGMRFVIQTIFTVTAINSYAFVVLQVAGKF